MRKQNSKIIEVIKKMEAGGEDEWSIVEFLLELVQFRTQAAIKSNCGTLASKRTLNEE